MKLKFLPFILLLFMLAACSSGNKQNATVSFTDMAGREVSFTGKAERIVALAASDCEIIYALGAQEKLVGRGEYCDYPAEIAEIPSVQSGYETNIEQLIALEPQVVIMSIMSQTKEQADMLEASGITVVTSDAQDINGVYTAIEIIGKVTGKESEAESLIQGMKSGFDELKNKIPENNGEKTVYFEVSPLEWGLWTAGEGTFLNEIADMLGLKNIFSDLQGWAEISQEQVISRNPDYIITIAMYFGEGERPEDEIKNRVGWQDINAVKNGRVFLLDSDEISRPGPRLVSAAQSLYGFVYE